MCSAHFHRIEKRMGRYGEIWGALPQDGEEHRGDAVGDELGAWVRARARVRVRVRVRLGLRDRVSVRGRLRVRIRVRVRVKS